MSTIRVAVTTDEIETSFLNFKVGNTYDFYFSDHSEIGNYWKQKLPYTRKDLANQVDFWLSIIGNYSRNPL